MIIVNGNREWLRASYLIEHASGVQRELMFHRAERAGIAVRKPKYFVFILKEICQFRRKRIMGNSIHKWFLRGS